MEPLAIGVFINQAFSRQLRMVLALDLPTIGDDPPSDRLKPIVDGNLSSPLPRPEKARRPKGEGMVFVVILEGSLLAQRLWERGLVPGFVH